MVINFDPKSWLESYDSAVPVAETAFTPRDEAGRPRRIHSKFIVFHDDQDADGADLSTDYIAHDLTIELYTKDGNDRAFRDWLLRQDIHFQRRLIWLPTEQMFESIFYLTDTVHEKIQKE